MPQTGGTFRVHAGASHACATRPDGRVYCWGLNIAGEIGAEGLSGYVLAPRALPFYQGASLSLGVAATCGIVGGRVSCQGSNGRGLLATGVVDTEAHPDPRLIAGLEGSVGLAIRGIPSYAIGAGGEVLRWGGLGVPDPAGPGGMSGAGAPPSVAPGFEASKEIVASGFHRCALRCDGRVVCQGSNRRGECGLPPSDDVAAPTVVEGLDRVTGVAIGDRVSCALRDDRSMWCWGSNAWGELGRTGVGADWHPAPVPGLSEVSAMSASLEYPGGGTTVCAVDRGRLLCWGRVLGVEDGEGTRAPTPTPVPGVTEPVTQVALGKQFGVVVGPGGDVRCWGIAGNCGRDLGPQRLFLPEAVLIELPRD